jgi:hypothetical protein
VAVNKLALSLGVSLRTLHNTLHQDLNLSKKSGRGAPKPLIRKMKKERMKMCKAFLGDVHLCTAMLDNVVTMDKSVVSFHTSDTAKSRPA